MDIKGKVKQVLPMLGGTTAKGEWKRQVVVVEYVDGQYTSTVALENTKKADEFAKLSVGDECTFKCNMPTSREYNGRWYTSVNCWGWDVDSKAENIAPAMPSMPEPMPTMEMPKEEVVGTPKSSEDVPF